MAALAATNEHLRLLRLQRNKAAEEAARSRTHPDALAMVGVDQSNGPGLPHRCKKTWGRVHLLKLMYGGTLSESTGTGAFYISLLHDKGPNLVLTQLYLQLREVLTSGTSASLRVRCSFRPI